MIKYNTLYTILVIFLFVSPVFAIWGFGDSSRAQRNIREVESDSYEPEYDYGGCSTSSKYCLQPALPDVCYSGSSNHAVWMPGLATDFVIDTVAFMSATSN